jgi:hypothetical protein
VGVRDVSEIIWDNNMEQIMNVCIEKLGLRNPSDDTVRNLVAIMSLCHPRELTPAEGCTEVHKVKDKFVSKRELMPGKQKMIDYPSDVIDFASLYPNACIQREPPIPIRIDHLEIRQLTRKHRMPTRSTNEQIVSSKVSTSSSSSSQVDVAHQLAAMAFQFVMGGQGLVPPGLPNRQIQKRQSLLHIEDGPEDSPRQSPPRILTPLAIGDQASIASIASSPDASVLAMPTSKQSSKRSIGAGGADQCEDGEDGLNSEIEMGRSTLANKATRTSTQRKTAGPPW